MNENISMESLLPWDTYFRKYVNRREASLLAPRIFPVEEFKLSKGSVLHYLPASFSDTGPSVDDPIFKGVARNISSYYIDHLETLEGNPRLLTLAINSEIRKYHTENRKIRRVFDLAMGTRDIESPLIINYCYLNRRYKYLTNPKKDWYYNNNLLNTIVKVMNDVYKSNENTNQFLLIEVPKVIPGLPIFNAVNAQESNNYCSKFNSFTLVLLLHIYNLLNNGENSTRHTFNEINKRALDKINIVFVESGYCSILNLGTVTSFIKSVDNTSGKNPRIIRLYFIRFILSLMKVRSNDIDELIDRAESVDNGESSATELIEDEIDYTNPDVAISDKDDIESDNDETDTEIDTHRVDINTPIPDKVEEKEIDKSIKVDTNTDTLYYDSSILSQDEERELSILEKQLESQLNNIEESINKREIKQVEASQSSIFDEPEVPLEEEILYQLDDMLDIGLISPTDYEKYQKLATSYKTIKVDNTTLEEYTNIKKEDIVVTPTVIPDNPIIKNKDMLESTLINLNKKYTKEVLPRDIASMVLATQRGGVCITDYKVEETEDSSGRFNNYEVKIVPLKGKSSTVKFKLPVITEDGSYYSNNTEYKLRNQIVD